MISAATTEPTEITSVLQSASRSAGLAANARQSSSPRAKLPTITETLGSTTLHARSASMIERRDDESSFHRVSSAIGFGSSFTPTSAPFARSIASLALDLEGVVAARRRSRTRP